MLARSPGGSASFQPVVTDGNTDTGFQSSDLNWSALACWPITADHNGDLLTFTVWLEPLPGG